MFSRHHRKVRTLFAVSDVVLTLLAFHAAYVSRLWIHLERNFYLSGSTYALLIGFSALAWVTLAIWLGIYEKLDSGNPRVILRDALRQCVLSLTALVLFQYVVRLDTQLSRSFIGLFGIYSWTFLCLFRLLAGNAVGGFRGELNAPLFVMIAGVGESAKRLAMELERSARYGVRLSGFLTGDPAASPQRIRLQSEYEVHPLANLPQLLRERVIDEVLFTLDGGSLSGLDDILVRCDEEGVRTRVLLDFFPHVNSEMYLDRLGSMPLLTFAAAPHDDIRLSVKRLLDLTIAASALVLLLPLLALAALAIRLTSRGPIIFAQERCGLNGRRFRFYKFRSMCENAEELKPSLEHLNRKSTAFKIPGDPRRTPIGRYLRKFSIDEFPQLWNVLRGDMSLVGPRPAVPDEVAQYKGWQRRRLRMRPGLTCLWAIEGRDELEFENWMKWDMEYIDNWSLALDLKILLLTIPRVLTGKGAY